VPSLIPSVFSLCARPCLCFFFFARPQQALRNQELLDGMEQKGAEVEDGGREFQSLAAKLKAKSKAQRF